MPMDPFLPAVFLYEPLVWTIALFTAIIGILGLIAPAALRLLLKAFDGSVVRNSLAILMIITGICMMLRPYRPYANALAFPTTAIVFGAILAVKGALWMFWPRQLNRLLAFHAGRGNGWMRLLGIVCLAAAALFALVCTRIGVVHF